MKIVTIGGGTGAPIILRALIKAGFEQIDAISAAMDSGGQTGVIRSDERELRYHLEALSVIVSIRVIGF